MKKAFRKGQHSSTALDKKTTSAHAQVSTKITKLENVTKTTPKALTSINMSTI